MSFLIKNIVVPLLIDSSYVHFVDRVPFSVYLSGLI